MIEERLAREVIGYFSYYRTGNVLCDGDACVISGTKDLMHAYRKWVRVTTQSPAVTIQFSLALLPSLASLKFNCVYHELSS